MLFGWLLNLLGLLVTEEGSSSHVIFCLHLELKIYRKNLQAVAGPLPFKGCRIQKFFLFAVCSKYLLVNVKQKCSDTGIFFFLISTTLKSRAKCFVLNDLFSVPTICNFVQLTLVIYEVLGSFVPLLLSVLCIPKGRFQS